MKTFQIRYLVVNKAIPVQTAQADRIGQSIRLIILTSLLMLAGCTSLTYNVNHYQDGKTLGKGKVETRVALGVGRTFESTVESSRTNFEVETIQTETLVANTFGRYGVSPNLDVGADAFLSFEGTGVRVFVKVGLTDSLSKWGVSLMPVIGYAQGTSSEGTTAFNGREEREKTSSSGFAFELAVPISYQASSEFAIHFGPKVYYYSYKVSSSISSSGGPDPFSESRSLRRSYFSPGFSLGVRFDTINPEVTVVLVEKKLVPYLGVAVRLRPSFF